MRGQARSYRIHPQPNRNGAGSIGSGWSSICAVSSFALPSARVKPRAPWPTLSHRLLKRPARSMIGLLCGVLGRKPAQACAWSSPVRGR